MFGRHRYLERNDDQGWYRLFSQMALLLLRPQCFLNDQKSAKWLSDCDIEADDKLFQIMATPFENMNG